MRLRLVLLITLSLATAGGAAYMTQNWLQSEREAQATPAPEPEIEAPRTKVLVASQNLPAGTVLQLSQMQWQVWPDEGVVEGYFVENGEADPGLSGAVIRQSMARGEPFTERRIVRPGDRGFLAAMLEEGKRAMSVPVNAATGISGLIFPGDRVDVILTHSVDGERSDIGATRRASETVVSDIRVLGLDQRTDDDDEQRVVAKTATLEVTPKQAETLSLAQQLGSLSLSLRSIVRDGEEGVSGPTVTVDTEISRVIRNPPRPQAQTSSNSRQTVRVVRGGEVQELSFEGN